MRLSKNQIVGYALILADANPEFRDQTNRTYNISVEAVATVKRLVEERHPAPSQDGLVEQAITDFTQRIEDTDDARLWQAAGADPQFQAEVEQFDAEFAEDDLRAWES